MRRHPAEWVVYGVFLWATTTYLYKRHLFRDVEHWPSVPATHVTGGSSGGGFPYTPRDGNIVRTSAASWVEFDYEVDGKSYRGSTGKPGGSSNHVAELQFQVAEKGGSAPEGGVHRAISGSQETRAYYHPGRPGIAVLTPTPYRSTAMEVTMAASGLLVLLHLFFVCRKEW